MQGPIMEISQRPGWLIIRLAPPDDSVELADTLWGVIDQHGVYSVVLQLDELKVLRSRLVGELVRLYKTVLDKGGQIRLVGLSDANQMVLRMNRLESRLPHFADIDSATTS